MEAIPKDAKVAVGGSMTIRELGIIEEACCKGKQNNASLDTGVNS